jgi:ankyrin repeat protein
MKEKVILQAIQEGDIETLHKEVQSKKGLLENIRDVYGNTVLHLAIMSPCTNRQALVKYMLNKKIALDATNQFGYTALHLAFHKSDGVKGQTDIVGCLWPAYESAGESFFRQVLTTADQSQRLILHYAVRKGELSWVQKITLAGSPLNEVDTTGMTPLHEAVKRGHLSIAQWLISQGARTNLHDHRSPTLLDLAMSVSDAPKVTAMMLLMLLHTEQLTPREWENWRKQTNASLPTVELETIQHIFQSAHTRLRQSAQDKLAEQAYHQGVLAVKNLNYVVAIDNFKMALRLKPDFALGQHALKEAELACQVQGLEQQLAALTTVQAEKVALSTRIQFLETHGLVPEEKAFYDLLIRTKRLLKEQRIQPVTCYISYGWLDTNTEEGQAGQAQLHQWLIRLETTLRTLKINVFLDIKKMQGDLRHCMQQNIESSDYIILIGTPCFKQKAENDNTHLHFEYELALKQKAMSPHALIPLLYKGSIETSFPREIKHSLIRDYQKAKSYYAFMTDLENLGVIPAIYPMLADSKAYQVLLQGFQDKLTSLQQASCLTALTLNEHQEKSLAKDRTKIPVNLGFLGSQRNPALSKDKLYVLPKIRHRSASDGPTRAEHCFDK